jgi:hypothetical protein
MFLMRRRPVIALLLFGAMLAGAQSIETARRKTPGITNPKPECSEGAICFSGEVSRGQEFHRALNDDLEFVLQEGWEIAIVPRKPEGDCKEFADVVNPPYQEHKPLYINLSYGHSAEWEMTDSPREFRFVTNCADYRTDISDS